jgi:hypothetical protein
MRQAMAPRLAIRTLSNMAAKLRYRGGSSRLLSNALRGRPRRGVNI